MKDRKTRVRSYNGHFESEYQRETHQTLGPAMPAQTKTVYAVSTGNTLSGSSSTTDHCFSSLVASIVDATTSTATYIYTSRNGNKSPT